MGKGNRGINLLFHGATAVRREIQHERLRCHRERGCGWLLKEITMKRGVVGEAEKHVIRRKIDEKLVMIREQRKVLDIQNVTFDLPDGILTVISMHAQRSTVKRPKTLNGRAHLPAGTGST